MATKTKKPVRVIRSYEKDREYVSPYDDQTLIYYFKPEIKVDYKEFGLDGKIELGRRDLEKLGMPNRIKVVIYNIDD